MSLFFFFFKKEIVKKIFIAVHIVLQTIFLKYKMYFHLSLSLSRDASRPQSRRCRRRDRRGFHGKGSKRTYAPSRTRCKGGGRRLEESDVVRGGQVRCAQKEHRGGQGGQRKPRGTSPAASNRKGKTPGERELVFGDIAVTGRRRRRRRRKQRRRRKRRRR